MLQLPFLLLFIFCAATITGRGTTVCTEAIWETTAINFELCILPNSLEVQFPFKILFTHFPQSSLQVLENVMVDRSVTNAPPLSRFQFERVGYFCMDSDSTEGKVTAIPTYLSIHLWYYHSNNIFPFTEALGIISQEELTNQMSNQMNKTLRGKEKRHGEFIRRNLYSLFCFSFQLVFNRTVSLKDSTNPVPIMSSPKPV